MASFEENLAELEHVVGKLERGGLPLEENVTLFERGVALSESCKKELSSAESRIQVLANPGEKGPARMEELDVDVEEDEE